MCSLELGQEVQRIEDLEIPLGAGYQAVSTRVGKGAAGLFLGLVDHLPGFGDLDQARQTEGTTSHVPHQTLDALLVAGRQVHRLVDAEAAVLPGAHVLDHFRFDLALGQVQGVPMNEFPMSLYCPYHAGQHILAAEHASHFGLDA